jgi:PHD/YefM family antitoxin component YafN of YafNO toxin-antitoxin module
MSDTETATEHPRIPLTRFHNNTGEFLELATRSPVVITSDDRERYVVCDFAYFRRLEELAAGNLAQALDLRVQSAGAMSAQRGAEVRRGQSGEPEGR